MKAKAPKALFPLLEVWWSHFSAVSDLCRWFFEPKHTALYLLLLTISSESQSTKAELENFLCPGSVSPSQGCAVCRELPASVTSLGAGEQDPGEEVPETGLCRPSPSPEFSSLFSESSSCTKTLKSGGLTTQWLAASPPHSHGWEGSVLHQIRPGVWPVIASFG